MKATGLEAAPSRLVKPPRVAASPCALECKWLQTVRLKDIDGAAARTLRGVRPGDRRLYRRPLHQERPARHRRDEADRALRLRRIRHGRDGVQNDPAQGRRAKSGLSSHARCTAAFATPRPGTAFTITTRPPCIAAVAAGSSRRRRTHWFSRVRAAGETGIAAPKQHPTRPCAPAEPPDHRACARRRRRARLCPYRRDPHAARPRHRARHHRRHLDRRGGRRLLRRRPARRHRGLGARPDQARHPRLSRHQPVRRRPDRRRQARGAAGREARQHADRGAADPLCHHHHRGRHRPRDLADARPPGRCDARVLRAARNFSAGFARRPLAGRRRAGQSGAGVGRARARRAARHRGQSQLRHSRPQHDHGRRERRARRRSRSPPAPRGLRAMFGAEHRSSASSSAAPAAPAFRP